MLGASGQGPHAVKHGTNSTESWWPGGASKELPKQTGFNGRASLSILRASMTSCSSHSSSSAKRSCRRNCCARCCTRWRSSCAQQRELPHDVQRHLARPETAASTGAEVEELRASVVTLKGELEGVREESE